MNKIYTAYLYRNNGSDWCCGHQMGATDSDFSIYQSNTIEELFDLIVPIFSNNSIEAKSTRELQDYSVGFSINGVFHPCTDYLENSVLVDDEDLIRELNYIQSNFIIECEKYINNKIQEIENIKRQKAEKEELERKEKQVQHDLNELKRLKEKYE